MNCSVLPASAETRLPDPPQLVEKPVPAAPRQRANVQPRTRKPPPQALKTLPVFVLVREQQRNSQFSTTGGTTLLYEVMALAAVVPQLNSMRQLEMSTFATILVPEKVAMHPSAVSLPMKSQPLTVA